MKPRCAIDVHSHLSPPAYIESLRSLPEDPSITAALSVIDNVYRKKWPLLYGDTGSLLAQMDQAGIDAAVLSFATPYIFPASEQARAGIVRAWNDACSDVVLAHRSRLSLFASVPLPYVDAAIAETERVALLPGTVGLTINTHTLSIPIDDERWYPLYQLWNDLELTVFLHPDGFCVKGLLDRYAMNWDLGTQLDDVIAAVRLINSGILTQFPKIRWIVAHLGGALPFVLGRLDQHWERDKLERSLAVRPSQALDGLLFDTAGHSAASIRFAADTLGAHRIVFGSDFPIVGAYDLAAAVGNVEEALSTDDAASVLSGNAAAILRRLPSARDRAI